MTALPRIVLKRSTTAQQVADGLSEQIMAGAFSAGDRLRESALATELGVARNTMREAVRILELSGLVRYEVNRGAVVISPTPEKVDALYTAREVLETTAAARVPTPDQLAVIVATYEEFVAVTASVKATLIVEKDLAFHAAIVAMLGSSRIDSFYAELTRELRFYLMVLSVQDREYENSVTVRAEHQVIVDAIRSRDPDRAVAEVRAHIYNNAARLKEILAGREWGASTGQRAQNRVQKQREPDPR
jgi:DNA-binding GntR family transcriptional regulator